MNLYGFTHLSLKKAGIHEQNPYNRETQNWLIIPIIIHYFQKSFWWEFHIFGIQFRINYGFTTASVNCKYNFGTLIISQAQ